MYWLAQRRGGVAKPDFVTRTPGEGWPQPLLLYMRGKYTEAELLEPIKAGDEDQHAARTPAPTSDCARRCSTSARNTGRAASPTWHASISRRWSTSSVAFIEHGLALAEIAKLTP